GAARARPAGSGAAARHLPDSGFRRSHHELAGADRRVGAGRGAGRVRRRHRGEPDPGRAAGLVRRPDRSALRDPVRLAGARRVADAGPVLRRSPDPRRGDAGTRRRAAPWAKHDGAGSAPATGAGTLAKVAAGRRQRRDGPPEEWPRAGRGTEMAVDLIYETHSTTTHNEAGIATGWLPGELSETGRQQARALGERRRDEDLAAVISSDLRRAVQTVDLAFDGTDIPRYEDARLRECNYGALNGTPVTHLEFPRHIDEPFPGGENYRQVVARTRDFLADLVRDFDGRRVVVIAHSAKPLGARRAGARPPARGRGGAAVHLAARLALPDR